MRKNQFGFIGLIALFISFSGCAFGPLVNHETGRTVGSSNHELIAGYGNAGYVVKWNIGLDENTDIGFQLESLSLGLRLKHAFINNSTHGLSFAAAAGVGTSIGGSHYYGDAILSYLSGWFEPYGTMRVVHVNTDPVEARNENTGEVAFTINRSEYNYGQLILGSRFWLSPHVLLSIEVSSLSSLSSGFDLSNPVIAGAALGYRF
ncbi:hypothetical protein BH10BDE1_BH10BDE1_16350 [soil metagenome]